MSCQSLLEVDVRGRDDPDIDGTGRLAAQTAHLLVVEHTE